MNRVITGPSFLLSMALRAAFVSAFVSIEFVCFVSGGGGDAGVIPPLFYTRAGIVSVLFLGVRVRKRKRGGEKREEGKE